MKKIIFSVFVTSLLLGCQRTPKDIPAERLTPTAFQEDRWKFEYTSTELPGNLIDDGYAGKLQASGQWSVFNFKATNTSSKKLDIWDSDLAQWILMTSDGKKWEYQAQTIYPQGLNTVQPNQSYNLKIAFDIAINTKPKTLIYEFYDEDFNQNKFEFSISP